MPSDSLERLSGSSNALSPIQYHNYSSSYRDIRSTGYPARDIHLSVRDVRLPTVYDSAVPMQLSHRSKSYHGDLNRVPASVFNGLSKYNSDLLGSHRSLLHYSHSTYNNLFNNNCRSTCSNYSILSVNAYSKHYSHHNHWSNITSQPLNSRCRFHKRHVYKAYRSRSANPLNNDEYDLSRKGCRSAFLRSPSTQLTASRKSHIWTKSMSDIHSSPSATVRLHYSVSSILPRYSSVRTMIDSSAYSKSILNPDVYVRWLRSKRCMEDVVRRRDHVPTYRFIDSIGISERRERNTSNYVSCYGNIFYRSPKLVHPIKGNPSC